MNSHAVTIENVCSQRSELAAYIDGELSPREELELEIHLAICKSCSEELNEQKKLLRALDFALENENEIELPANFTRIVVANAESHVSGLRRPQERSKSLFVCAALLLLVLLGLGGETRTIFVAFTKFAEQLLAVGGFVWHLIYDVAVGTAIILRSLSHQIVFDRNFSVAVLIGFFFISFVFASRFMARANRP
jgi:anti-sigma factor RsiW